MVYFSLVIKFSVTEMQERLVFKFDGLLNLCISKKYLVYSVNLQIENGNRQFSESVIDY